MNRVSELKGILEKKFDWNKARLDCFCRMLLALFKVRTVNLSEIAVGFEGSTSVESRYKRLYRFFRQFKMDYAALAHWMTEQFSLPEKFYLTIDRTKKCIANSLKIIGIVPLILAHSRDAPFLPRPPSSATLRAGPLVHALRTACSNGFTLTKNFLNSLRSSKNSSATADYSPPLRYPWLAALVLG